MCCSLRVSFMDLSFLEETHLGDDVKGKPKGNLKRVQATTGSTPGESTASGADGVGRRRIRSRILRDSLASSSRTPGSTPLVCTAKKIRACFAVCVFLLDLRKGPRSPSSALSHPLLGEGSPTKTDYRKKGYPFSNLCTGGPRGLNPTNE